MTGARTSSGADRAELQRLHIVHYIFTHLDILAKVVAAGIVGNLAHDALKAAIASAPRPKRMPFGERPDVHAKTAQEMALHVARSAVIARCEKLELPTPTVDDLILARWALLDSDTILRAELVSSDPELRATVDIPRQVAGGKPVRVHLWHTTVTDDQRQYADAVYAKFLPSVEAAPLRMLQSGRDVEELLRELMERHPESLDLAKLAKAFKDMQNPAGGSP